MWRKESYRKSYTPGYTPVTKSYTPIVTPILKLRLSPEHLAISYTCNLHPVTMVTLWGIYIFLKKYISQSTKSSNFVGNLKSEVVR